MAQDRIELLGSPEFDSISERHLQLAPDNFDDISDEELREIANAFGDLIDKVDRDHLVELILSEIDLE